MKIIIVNVFTLFLLLSCSNSIVTSLSAKQQLKQVILTAEIFHQNSNPFNKAEIGGNNARLPDLSPKKFAQDNRKLAEIYHTLLSIDDDELTTKQQINKAVLTYSIKNELDDYRYKAHYIPLTAESGFHVWISKISRQVKMVSEQDFIDYLARLKALPKYFDQQMAWMDKGIASGITQPQVVLQGFEKSIKAFIKEDVTQSGYYQPFKQLPDYFSTTLKNKLRQQAKKALTHYVMPSYQKYYHYMVTRYQPNARQNIAATSLPNGLDFYKNRVAYYTTLPMSIDEVHQLGLNEVARIHEQMQIIIKQVGFKGSFAQFIQFLRNDPQFYAKTPRDLLKEASYIAKKMDGKLPSLFKILPRKPYGIAPVPANIAPKYTTGRYSPPQRNDQAGSYWVNTYRLDRRPLYVLPALTLHEAVPGHHLQGSLASEMKNVPAFRNETYISAFGEGWGLYAEYLGVEAGIYETPYQEFGRLTYEMWRACRLVVDTGMHAKGWSRQRAIDYLASNTALSLHNVNTEIDRYISWPAQALSYKIGELTIKRLRRKAEQALGSQFDLREFHDQILKNGSMPLSSLEKVINKYIEQKRVKVSV
ncbi:MAG: DUF885 domain-containing protein [Alteromonadaceae bacterium]|nr:DUF885 domain-containing protein [Alteromonadaceae bacterium]